MLVEAEKLDSPLLVGCASFLEESVASALAIWCWSLQEAHSVSVCTLIMSLPTHNLKLYDIAFLCCLSWLPETAFSFPITFYVTLMLLYISLHIDF